MSMGPRRRGKPGGLPRTPFLPPSEHIPLDCVLEQRLPPLPPDPQTPKLPASREASQPLSRLAVDPTWEGRMAETQTDPAAWLHAPGCRRLSQGPLSSCSERGVVRVLEQLERTDPCRARPAHTWRGPSPVPAPPSFQGARGFGLGREGSLWKRSQLWPGCKGAQHLQGCQLCLLPAPQTHHLPDPLTPSVRAHVSCVKMLPFPKRGRPPCWKQP